MRRSLWMFVVVPALALLAGYVVVTWRLPRSFTLTINVASPVRVDRDKYGIPTITAESVEDAMYALGYVMCEDRMWQLDVLRRLATGRMAEFFGPNAVELDKFIRNMKLARSAQDDISSLSPDDLRVGQNFVRGINDAAHSTPTPLEYLITGSQWEDFTLADSQSNIYFVSLFLSNIWGSDAFKSQLKALLGDRADYLIPADVSLIKPKSSCVNNEELADHIKGPPENLKVSDFNEHIEFYTEIFDMGTGSNSWVISGNHTKSGKPILCNDPHLTPTVPSLWYLNRIRIGSYSQYGAALTGFPITSIGRNNFFSWGTTSLKADDFDIYAEKLVNSSHYVYGEELLPFKEFEEKIRIKGQPDLLVTYRETVHGPMIENSIVGVKKTSGSFSLPSSKYLSVAWASLYQKDQSFGFVKGLMASRTLEELRSSHSKTTAIRLSVIASSTRGDIAYLAVGKVPIKSYRGDQVLPGWNPETKWKGFIPFDEMPFTLNPKKGFIVTANNFPAGSHYKYFESLGTYFSLARADRITEVIQERIDSKHLFTAEDQIELLKDELDVFARELAPVLLKKLKSSQVAQEKVRSMEKWDFVMSRDSKPAALYNRWLIEIAVKLMEGRVKADLLHSFLRNQVMTNNFYNFFQDFYIKNIDWLCDDPKTQVQETCEDLITQAFAQAAEYVGDKTWGQLHGLTLKHIPFSEVAGLKWLFERKQEMGGNSNTIHATYINWNSTLDVHQGPGMKFIADMGNTSALYLSLESGISENVFSPHYSDMFQGFHYDDLPRFDYN